jgi:hypothetical protein
MSRCILIASVMSLFVVPALGQTLPKRDITPGVVLTKIPAESVKCLSDLMGETLSADDPVTLTMICTQGYAKCIRNVPSQTKQEVYRAYGLSSSHAAYCNTEQGCEIDHLISLELGGSNDQKNLWPQPYQGEEFNAHVKDQLENFYHAEVCRGRIKLKDAQKDISEDWISAYRNLLGSP